MKRQRKNLLKITQFTKMESKSKNKEYLKLAIILGVLFLILGGFLLYVSIPLLSTKTVVLATQPVDPFDLIRGQYIVIRYEIASIPSIEGAEVGDNIYVSLMEDTNGTARYKTASLDKPSKEDLFIRGQVNLHEARPRGILRQIRTA
ncbi:hypothetical protein COU54_02270 [Candidatus Pacearchaeota archaeon CG10_big_fil_rev_8_21_14_0_10_31_24]|nr:MAG: hypothetical protein COU54_02270 [Candidatus Pacearchaeota archaeon CG10_big_fil_rev_8_21_14_0_10_31_24]